MRSIPVFAGAVLVMGGLASFDTCAAARGDQYGDALPPRAKARIGTTRFRHGGPITDGAFSPNGRTVATASRDGTVSVWDVATGKELCRSHGHVGPVLAVAFLSSGERWLSGGVDGTIRFWRIPRPKQDGSLPIGEEIRRLRVHTEEVQAIALSADGSTAGIGTAEGLISLWDLTAGKEKHRFSQEGQVYCVALSHDGKQVAVNQAASGIVLRNCDTGTTHRLGASVVTSLAFSADGHTLAAGYQNDQLSLWDTRRGGERRIHSGQDREALQEPRGILSGGFSADGQRLVSGGMDQRVRVWEIETERLMWSGKGHVGQVTLAAFAHDGKTVLSGGNDSTLRLWDVATGRILSREDEPLTPLTCLSVSANGQTVVVGQASNRLSSWDARTGREQALPAAVANVAVLSAVFSPVAPLLALASEDGSLRFWDVSTRTLRIADRESPRRLDQLVWSRDGAALASSGPDHAIDLWDPSKAELLQHMGLQEDAYRALAFDRQGERLATASATDVIRIWDRATGLERRPVHGSFAGALALSFSMNGRTLCAAGSDGQVRLWELATNQPRLVFGPKGTEVTAAAFTADGRFLATGGNDGLIRLWDPVTGSERHVFRGHRGPITMLAFAARSPILASASQDTTALIWDVEDFLHIEPPAPLHLGNDRMEALWKQLAREPQEAFAAMQILQRAPQQCVRSFRGRMQPIKIDFRALIADLDSDEFRVRQLAFEQLTRHGRLAEKYLRQTLEKNPSLEVRRRIQDLLQQLEEGPEIGRAEPRELRCIELLETLGTAEARRLLQILASGLPEAEVTQEAKASLHRLGVTSSPLHEPRR